MVLGFGFRGFGLKVWRSGSNVGADSLSRTPSLKFQILKL